MSNYLTVNESVNEIFVFRSINQSQMDETVVCCLNNRYFGSQRLENAYLEEGPHLKSIKGCVIVTFRGE